MNQFLAAFLPDVTATIIGVLLGLPVALWLDRKARCIADRRQNEESCLHLQKGINAILAALKHNQKCLINYIDTLRKDNLIQPDLDLDVAAWDASQSEIIPFLSDPDLQRRIAHHFGRLSSISRLADIYTELMIGVASALTNAKDNRSKLRYYLIDRSQGTVEEAGGLIEELQDLDVMKK